MKDQRSSRVSLNVIAKEVGVSKAAVGFALHNRPGVSAATRQRILQVAGRLGYSPDPRISSWMARVQGARTKDLLPIAWLDTHKDKGVWKTYKFLSPILEGARARALQLGYRLDEIWVHEPGMTMRRISQVVYRRGIEGAIVTQFARHFRLKWDHLAGVAIGSGLLAPQLDRIMADDVFNLNLALKMVRRFGYRRVGVCLEQDLDAYANHGCRAAVRDFLESIPADERIEPLFYSWGRSLANEALSREIIVEWIRRCQPDVVICHSCHMVKLAERAGRRVPGQTGVVHIATDDDVSDWAGVHSNRREIGAAAVSQAVFLMQNRQFGVPKTALNIMVRGSWHPGATLITPGRIR